ncbi:MAG TPA: SCP2 sterol-binding domain-containing protein, partial [Acidimicrobiales bacterium]
MASWDELAEALADYTVSCNENARLRKMQRDWSRTLHFICADTGSTFSMMVERGEILSVPEGHVGTPDIVVTAESEIFCDMFWGDLNPVQKYLRGEITVKGSQE